MLEYSPFAEILDSDMKNSSVDLRPVRNVAKFSQIVTKYEYLHNVNLLTPKSINTCTKRFFDTYMRFLYYGGIEEYEDDSEYAPSGCVSFLTIHQSKGMEFPIVVVDSLNNSPRNRNNNILNKIGDKYFKRNDFEPLDKIKFYDFWRLYYTAFSRAQNLLVLTCDEKEGRGKRPSKYFEWIYKKLPDFFSKEFNIDEFDFKEIKDVNLKEAYAFTSHIAVYENCSLQYKFFKELEFAPVRVGATLFGTLVHQTIEDIHRSVLRGETNLISPDNITLWFNSNYAALINLEHTYLAEPQLNAALNQVIKYAEREGGNWSKILQTEVDVSLVKQDYILKGTIDLVTGEGDSVEIVDFKSEKKPDIFANQERIEHYKKQLQIYAYLVEKKTGRHVSKMHLYYTGAENENSRISFKKDQASVDDAIREFDNIVKRIQKKDFSHKADKQSVCDNCDFRYYCSNIRKE